MTDSSTRAARLYRVGLGLLPRGFREAYGEGMEGMFRDEWRARGGWGRVVLAVRVGLDLAWTALAVRMRGTDGSTAAEGTKMTWTGMGIDLRASLRALRRSPVFSTTAVLSLALGFGGVATVYALADHILLDPISGVHAPDELVELTPGGMPYPVIQDFQGSVRAFSGVAAHRMRTAALELGGGTDARPVQVGVVSGNYFDVVGVSAQRGRLLTPGDTVQGAPLVAVLSYAVWTELGRPEAVLGSDIRINGTPFDVVGVAPPRFVGLRLQAHPAIWIPVASWSAVSLGRTPDVHSRNWGWIAAVARLAPGASIAAATEEVRAVAARISTEHPENKTDLDGLGVTPARARVAEQAGAVLPPLLLALGGMALLALLAAAANVGSLLLARATRRTREMAVRAALGAGRVRLARLAAVECVLLVLAGGVLGTVLSQGALRALAAVPFPEGIRVDVGLGPDVRFMALASVLLLVVVLVAGLAPTLTAARSPAGAAGLDRAGDATPRGVRVRGFLAAAQVAAGVVLLAVTLLFGQSIVKALRVDLGFDASRMAVVHLDASLFKDDRAAVSRAVFGVTEEIRTRPGIDAASWSTVAPLTRDVEEESFDIVGRVWPDRRPVVEVNAVGGDFFDASGIPFIAGDPRAARGRVTTPVVVVTESMARRFWPDESPVGAHMVVMDTDFEVVGVVASTRFHGFDSDPVPMAYGVLPGVPGPSVSLVVRGNEVESVLADVRGIARSVDSRLVVTEVVTGAGMVDGLLAPQRLGGAVALLFAVLALALSLTGVYGVVAYGVTARLREFGIRLTLGAEPGRVAGEVLRKNVTLLLVGVVGGVAAAFALTRVAAAYLFGVDVADLGPATVSGVVVLIMALIATWLPARRAGQVDPAAVMAAE